jgi:hypothetical protein
MASSSSNIAFQTFNLENDIKEISLQDEIFQFDQKADKALNDEAPWSKQCVPSQLVTNVVLRHFIVPIDQITLNHVKSLLLH